MTASAGLDVLRGWLIAHGAGQGAAWLIGFGALFGVLGTTTTTDLTGSWLLPVWSFVPGTLAMVVPVVALHRLPLMEVSHREGRLRGARAGWAMAVLAGLALAAAPAATQTGIAAIVTYTVLLGGVSFALVPAIGVWACLLGAAVDIATGFQLQQIPWARLTQPSVGATAVMWSGALLGALVYAVLGRAPTVVDTSP